MFDEDNYLLHHHLWGSHLHSLNVMTLSPSLTTKWDHWTEDNWSSTYLPHSAVFGTLHVLTLGLKT